MACWQGACLIPKHARQHHSKNELAYLNREKSGHARVLSQRYNNKVRRRPGGDTGAEGGGERWAPPGGADGRGGHSPRTRPSFYASPSSLSSAGCGFSRN